ncbi:MAG TPA: patatin-like phospholipase family protein [Ktedonobacteraceae bacterium]|nr:patatin-like phospholipase family protein [Ktedonobacteraceae bacterium]
MKIRRRALVLQGGGALGAYAYGVIKALYEQPNFSLDIVTGVSIGAINAAVLVGARGDPIKALDELWRERLAIRNRSFLPSMFERYSSLLVNPGMYCIRPSYVYTPLLAPFLETSIYDITALRRTLDNLIDFKKLNDNAIHLVVSAVDIETGEVMYFGNQSEVPLSVEHILASGGLAPSFPMISIKDPLTGKERWYWDGGFSSNLPMTKAIDLLERADDGNPDVERELIVIELFPMRSKVPTNLIEVQERVIQLFFSSKLILDEQLLEKMNAYVDLIGQIDQALPPESTLRQHPGYQELKGHRKIDSFLVFTSTTPGSASGASDFSPAAIERKIAAGYRDALTQLKEYSKRSQQNQDGHLKVNRQVERQSVR